MAIGVRGQLRTAVKEHSLRLGPAGKAHPCLVPAVGIGSVVLVGYWETKITHVEHLETGPGFSNWRAQEARGSIWTDQ